LRRFLHENFLNEVLDEGKDNLRGVQVKVMVACHLPVKIIIFLYYFLLFIFYYYYKQDTLNHVVLHSLEITPQTTFHH
jgi:hypothetical protein